MSYSYQVPVGSDRKQPDYRHESATEYRSDPAAEPLAENDFHEIRFKDGSLKSNIRFLKVIVRFLTFGLSVFAVYTQAQTLYKFRSTKDIIRGGRDPWHKNTVLWPMAVLLGTSALTSIVSFATICGYFWGVHHANKQANNYGTPATVIEIAAHLAIWIATAVSYRVGKRGSDLWGWSCSPQAQAIQKEFPEVSFDFFCRLQGGSWIASLAQVVLFVVSMSVWTLAWKRRKHQKKMRIREGLMLPHDYAMQ